MFKKEKRLTFAIRKFAIGAASAIIGMSLFGSTEVLAHACSMMKEIDYHYVLEGELTGQERTLLQTNLSSQQVNENDSYYMVYRPVDQKVLPNTSDSKLLGATLLGTGFLLVGYGLTKKRYKAVVTGVFTLTSAGILVQTPAVEAISGTALNAFNQSFTLKVGDALPKGDIEISGYQFVGYIAVNDKKDCPAHDVANSSMILVNPIQSALETVITSIPKIKVDADSSEKVALPRETTTPTETVSELTTETSRPVSIVKEIPKDEVPKVHLPWASVPEITTVGATLKQETKPIGQLPELNMTSNLVTEVSTQVVPEAPITKIVTEIPTTKIETEAPITRIVTEEPVSRVVTETPVTRIVTEVPVTRVVTEAPVSYVVTEAPVTNVIGKGTGAGIDEKPELQLVTEAPATKIVTEAPVTKIITETPVTKVVTETPITRIVTEAPVTKIVTEAPITRIVTEAPVTKVVTEVLKTETPVTEAAETESSKTKTLVTEALKTESSKTETPVTEALKSESPKTETPVTESPKSETTTPPVAPVVNKLYKITYVELDENNIPKLHFEYNKKLPEITATSPLTKDNLILPSLYNFVEIPDPDATPMFRDGDNHYFVYVKKNPIVDFEKTVTEIKALPTDVRQQLANSVQDVNFPKITQELTQTQLNTLKTQLIDERKFNEEMLKLVNEERQRLNLRPIELHEEFKVGANIRATEQAQIGYFRSVDTDGDGLGDGKHVRPDGTDWGTAFTYLKQLSARGENMGQFESADLREIISESYLAKKQFELFKSSPDHYANMIDPTHNVGYFAFDFSDDHNILVARKDRPEHTAANQENGQGVMFIQVFGRKRAIPLP